MILAQLLLLFLAVVTSEEKAPLMGKLEIAVSLIMYHAALALALREYVETQSLTVPVVRVSIGLAYIAITIKQNLKWKH